MTTWALDIETERWDRFVLGFAVSDAGEVHALRSLDELAAWYLTTKSNDEVWAHNGGRYDALCLLDALGDSVDAFTANLAGACLVTVRVKGHATIRDSARLVSPGPCASLAKFAKAFGRVQKVRHGLPCKCRKRCGGFCQIRRRMSRSIRRRVEEYCEADARALLSALDGLFLYAEKAGIAFRGKKGKVRGTIGSWAWHTLVSMLGEEPPGACEDWSSFYLWRSGYYGGHVEVLRWESSSGVRDDLRSAYASTLAGPLPWGKPEMVTDGAAAFAKGRPGNYQIAARVDEVPLLPFRRSPRLLWPTGYVSGWYPRDEIRAAIDQGMQVIRWGRAVVTHVEKAWIRPLIDACFARRKTALSTGDKGIGGWEKTFGNSLSGKLAQSGKCGRVVKTTDTRGLPDGTEPYGERGDVWIVPTFRIPDSARPVVASAVTGNVRGPRVLPKLAALGDAGTYLDTDGVYGEKDTPEGRGDELGDWVREGEYHDWQSRAPKVYRYRDEKGRLHVKAKGFPGANGNTWRTLAVGRVVTVRRGVEGAKTALARSGRFFVARELRRALRGDARLCGARLKLPDGRTEAIRRRADGTLYWPSARGLEPEEVL